MSIDITERLEAAIVNGNLTVADLARWFDRPYATVNGWVLGGLVGGAPLDIKDVEARLLKLEKAIAKGKYFPVPRMAPSKRIEWLEEAAR